ncbi:MAG TPA: nucleotidyltransferase domain-containing protein [Spirochaetota bacterium]|nr:nucleotidyltransferase domain-containing protein [Spirochaetota bacterium]
MRLTGFQKKSIVDVIVKQFGSDVEIYLFGSRADDSKKGGDIDLLVDLRRDSGNIEKNKIKAITGIQFAIGDQKIDLIVTPDINKDQRLVVREALKTGVRL